MAGGKSLQTIRLNKLISDSGVCSRRQADGIIAEGRVTINGKRVYELGVKVNPHQDKVLLDGKPVRLAPQKIYLMFHKPTGVLTTMEDPLERPTIKSYLKEVPLRVFPVGRLDWDSEGLLLLTNDGDYAQKILHPRGEVPKTYLVKLKRDLTVDQQNRLLRGVSIIGGKVAASLLEPVKDRGQDKHPWFKIVITEGKNRQIRQMFEKVGNDVMKLQRVAIGKLKLGSLERGELVYLSEAAAQRVFEADKSLVKNIKLKELKKSQVSRPPSKAKGLQQVELAKKGKTLHQVPGALGREAALKRSKVNKQKVGKQKTSKKNPILRKERDIFK